MREQILFAVAVWLVMLGCYLVLAAPVSTSELIAGSAAAAVAAAYAVLLHRVESRRLAWQAAWLGVIVKSLAALFPDAIKVGRELARAAWRGPHGPLGSVTRQPFREGGENPRDAGRRGIVTLGISLAPNGYVLDIPPREDVLLMHRLVPSPPRENREWPA